MVKQLEATPGKHLVIVHSAPEHFADHEWVYNDADIDGSKIVWASEIPGQPLARAQILSGSQGVDSKSEREEANARSVPE